MLSHFIVLVSFLWATMISIKNLLFQQHSVLSTFASLSEQFYPYLHNFFVSLCVSGGLHSYELRAHALNCGKIARFDPGSIPVCAPV